MSTLGCPRCTSILRKILHMSNIFKCQNKHNPATLICLHSGLLLIGKLIKDTFEVLVLSLFMKSKELQAKWKLDN